MELLPTFSSLLQHTGERGGEETNTEETNDMAHVRRRQSPKKRAIALTAFLACLSFLLFGLNLLITFTSDLVKNDAMWNYLRYKINCSLLTNVTTKRAA